jgi:glutamate dehydrogenase/leucine dehydrogenase
MRVVDDAAVGAFERVVHAVDEDAGLRAVVAVRTTSPGPAIGGTRFCPYPGGACAAIDALRLADAMALKAAAAGLPVGGGKAVIAGDPGRLRGPRLWRAYGEVIDLFEGAFYTAEDVGTTVADMATLRRHTPYVLGLPGPGGWDGDPSPLTARGVVAAIGAAWEAETGSGSLEGARIVVQGVGKVGATVAGLLAAEGARLWVADANPGRAAAVAAWTGARAVDAAAAPAHPCDVLAPCAHPCDVLAPCAMGGLLRPETVGALRCRWVVGAANNQLSHDGVAALLAARGIGYLPDFVANAGGLIAVAAQLPGWDADDVDDRVEGIGDAARELIRESRASGRTPLATALDRARELVGAP